MKRFLLVTVIALSILFGSAYLLGNYVLKRASAYALVELPKHLASAGIELIDPAYETAGWSSFRSVYWTGLTARIRMQRDDSVVAKGSELFVGAYTLELTLRDFSFKRFLLDFERLNLVPLHGDSRSVPSISIVATDDPIHGRVTAPYARAVLEINPFNFRSTVETLQKEARAILLDGSTSLQVDCRGELTFNLRGRPRIAKILTEPAPGGYAFRLDRTDLMEISDHFDPPLTDAEIGLLSRYPLRTAKLLEIKEKAETVSEREFELDKKFPQDAYRHVLWSYLLTSAYDEEFAKEVTDAHERDAVSNTAAEREMDLRNNDVGRALAKSGVAESLLLAQFKSDPRVTQSPIGN